MSASLFFGAVVLAGGFLAAHHIRRLTTADDLHDVFDDDLVLGGRLIAALHDEAEHLATKEEE